jgi:hypothetical protein
MQGEVSRRSQRLPASLMNTCICSDESLQYLSDAISGLDMQKSDIGWDLESLEKAALAIDSDDSREEDSDDE